MYDIYGCKVNINMKKYLVNKYVINNMKSTCIYTLILLKKTSHLLKYIYLNI